MKLLTLRELQSVSACQSALDDFKRLFGASVQVTAAQCVKVADKFDWDWAAGALLSVPAQVEFDWVRADAWVEYQRVRADAQVEFERARATTWVEFEQVMVPALVEYHRVTAPALVEYHRVRAAEFGRLYGGGS